MTELHVGLVVETPAGTARITAQDLKSGYWQCRTLELDRVCYFHGTKIKPLDVGRRK